MCFPLIELPCCCCFCCIAIIMLFGRPFFQLSQFVDRCVRARVYGGTISFISHGPTSYNPKQDQPSDTAHQLYTHAAIIQQTAETHMEIKDAEKNREELCVCLSLSLLIMRKNELSAVRRTPKSCVLVFHFPINCFMLLNWVALKGRRRIQVGWQGGG